MTEISFKKNEDGSFEYVAQGHSGYAEPGEDIICAAVSILSYTLAQIVSVMEINGKLQELPVIEQDEDTATMTIIARPKAGEAYAECMRAYYHTQVGAHLLAQQAEEYVKLKPFGD